jgi:putative ABC transport system permease protein
MNRQWERYGFYTYLKLHPQPDIDQLESKITEHLGQQMGKDEEAQPGFHLEKLATIYLQGKARGSRYGAILTGSRQQIYIFSAVAVFVLFIACFNFINLSTAMSVQRAGEIGVRKVLGASRRQLMVQFLADSLLLSLLAMVVALVLAFLFLPTFNQLTGKIIRLQLFEHGAEVGGLLLGTLTVGLLSGLYPAIFLSAFPSLHSLKGKLLPRSRENLLSKGLIVGQFVISFILVSATLIVYQQLQYMQHKELGYDEEHKLVLDFHYDHQIVNRQEALKQQLLAVPGVEQATFSSALPGRANRSYETAIENADKRMSEFQSDVYFVDHDFVEQYQIELLTGRLFSKNLSTDSTEAMLVNEAAVRSLGYHDPAAIIGKRFEQRGRSGTIVGVLRDFHFHSFKEEIRPLTLRISPGWNLYTFITLDLATDELPATLSRLEQLWSLVAPGKPFLYFFADEAFQAQYVAEQRFARLFSYLALIAILISSLGLLGLAAFNTKLRFREIGIRKVLGASVPGLLLLLGGNYLRLILIALVIAIPLTNYFMSEWLMAFAYRVEVMWWFFALPAVLLLLIALATISSQTFRAARQNPVNSLRDE